MTWAQSLRREDPLEREVAPHSSMLAGESHGPEEPDGLTVHGVAKSQTRLRG